MIYYLPEVPSSSPFFFTNINSKKYDFNIIKSVLIPGFELWALKSSLAKSISPYTVVATENYSDPKRFSVFYEIEFSSRPNFEDFGFDTKLVDDKNVVYMKHEEIIKKGDFIFVKDGKWEEKKSSYHKIGCLYYLGIIPAISNSIFLENGFGLEKYSKDLQILYGVDGKLEEMLQRLFNDAFFLLNFFGFTKPKNSNEKEILAITKSYTKNIDSDQDQFSPFGDLEFGIINFNKKCYDDIENKNVFTPKTFLGLKNVFQIIKDMVVKLGFDVIEDDYQNSIRKILKHYKSQKKISEKYCKKETIRALLFDVGYNDEKELAKAAGFPLKKITPVICDNENDKNDHLFDIEREKLLNDINNYIEKSNDFNLFVFGKFEKCQERIKVVEELLNETSVMKDIVQKQLDDALDSIDNLLDENIRIQNCLYDLHRNIQVEKLTNFFLLLFAGLFFLSFLF